jgi:8-oxo-dGTP pyrophosphatase MutT (NUDIX family)
MIEAAGGVLWRDVDGVVEVLLVHRPARRDWSLPKGKLERRESHLECALREVREETGMSCTVGDELPQARYRDRKGRQKRVRYWAMSISHGEFRPNDEVDRIRWVDTASLRDELTYSHDLVVVAGLALARA